MKRQEKQRPASLGATVVDLIAVVAIVAVGVTLTLPVLQQCRETARKTVCEDRLGEIAVDSFMYHDVYERLPMQLGVSRVTDFDDWSNISSPSYFIWQQNTSPIALASSVTTEYDIDPIAFDFEISLFDQQLRFHEMEGWEKLASEQPARYLCPSASKLIDAVPVQGTTLALQPVLRFCDSQNKYCDGELGILFDQDRILGLSNYFGCIGAGSGGNPLFDIGPHWPYKGMITSRTRVTLDEVEQADGTSNTIMYGENIGEVKLARRGLVVDYKTSWFNGGIAQGRGGTAWMEPGSADTPLLGHAMNSSVRGFGSFHRDGVNFVRGDGSVTLVSRDIDVETYYALCGAFDTLQP